jgi:hypothetical protein
MNTRANRGSRRGILGHCVLALVLLAEAAFATTDQLGTSPLVGRWQFSNQVMRVTAEFAADGTFRQTTRTVEGSENYAGSYQLTGQVLQLSPQGSPMPLQFTCRFEDADTLVLTDAFGSAVRMKRDPPNSGTNKQKAPTASGSPAADSAPANAVVTNQPASSSPSPLAKSMKIPTLVLERTWEPNERAFWFLKPKGWSLSGGIFNVNPLQMNGPGNTLSPKNDLSVKKDPAGTVMFRWAPVWFYADLSQAQIGSGAFPTGSYYRGMLVKPILTPKEYLLEMLRSTRPGLSDLQIITEDPMREMVEAYVTANAQVNQALIRSGLHANTYDAAALLVEYRENGQRFREALLTVIVDTRASAFMWSNERTIMMRAPAEEYEQWKPVLDSIRASDHMNPQWVAEVNRQRGKRTQMVNETDRYLNKVANEIVAHRRQTHAETRHEEWLFISGQEEYKNPFSGEIERDTSYYAHRWVNNQGDVLLTDRNDLDPNEIEAYKTREWKRSAISDRPTSK